MGDSPLNLSPQEVQELLRIGRDIVEFVDAADESSLYVVQEFKKGEERKIIDEGDGSLFTGMAAKIRITPYFSMAKDSYDKLIAIKATGCEKINYIHASTGSINTAVA